jgi:hypothetical protein
MTQDLLESIRKEAAMLLDQPLDGLSDTDLYTRIKSATDAARDAFQKASFSGSTLTLNALLNLELLMRTKVLGFKRPPITA